MKLFAVALLLSLAAAATARSAGGAANAEDAKLEAFFKAYLEEEFRQRPLEATRLVDHRYDDVLDDVSAKGRKAWAERVDKTLVELPKQIAHKKLSRDGQIDFEIWQHDLQRQLWLQQNSRPFEDDPRVYNDYITESVYLLLTQSTLPQPRNVQNAVSRMKYLPRIVAAAKENLKNPPRVFVETAIKQNRGAIGFYQSGIFELAGESPAMSELKKAARPVVELLQEYQVWLEKELLPRATGQWRLGKEKFAAKLQLELDAGISSEEVLKEAESEAARVEAEMYVIARQLWSQVFPKKTLPADTDMGRQQTIAAVLDAVSKEHGKVENLVKDATAGAVRIKQFIKDKDILRLPDPDRCKIIEMPEFQRGNSIAFLNQAPALDPKASSYYAISPPPREWTAERVESYVREYNQHMLQILTIHEAYPGHYVQLEYSNKCPSLIRRVLFSGVFAEGWAVYTEQVMLDEGYGDGDLKLRLMQLKWYLRTVSNAILDYKMHSTNMTDEEAIRFLMLRAFQSEAEAILKVIRAKQSSCQLSTYFVGRMAFQRLRRLYQTKLGNSFELGRFHEACLAHGTLAVKYLPELVGERLKKPR
jgi:uncharacterized protein (DUF885 family)